MRRPANASGPPGRRRSSQSGIPTWLAGCGRQLARGAGDHRHFDAAHARVAESPVSRITSSRSMLTFLHLSDIHFADFDGPEGQHVDERVRELMLEDIERMANRLGTMDAILLVGDVANKGQEGEYRLASDFLDRAAKLIGCERENLACVPGNHDIDRGEHDAVHGAVRRALRAVATEEVSVTLRALLSEDHGARVLFDPLAASRCNMAVRSVATRSSGRQRRSISTAASSSSTGPLRRGYATGRMETQTTTGAWWWVTSNAARSPRGPTPSRSR